MSEASQRWQDMRGLDHDPGIEYSQPQARALLPRSPLCQASGWMDSIDAFLVHHQKHQGRLDRSPDAKEVSKSHSASLVH